MFHATGPSSDGWMVMAIHDSRQSWEQFRDETLMPRMQAGTDGGFASPRQETTFEVRTRSLRLRPARQRVVRRALEGPLVADELWF